MWDPLQYAVITASLLVAALSAVYVVRDLRPTPLLGLSMWAVEALLLVQLVVGVVQVVQGVPDGVSVVTYLSYLVGLLVAIPAAIWWARGEPSRAGTGVVLVVMLLIPVLVVRLEQIWGRELV